MSRCSAILILMVLGLAACTGETSRAAPRFPAIPLPVAYPGGIRTVLGVSSTPEFLAHTVTAATDRKRLAKDGFRIIRMDMLWEEIETAPGIWDWTNYDRIIDDLVAQGFEPLVLLAYGNPNYFSDPCAMPDGGIFPCLADDKEPFYRFARNVAERYEGRVQFFEVWNEPNGWFRFWPTAVGGDPAAYAELTRHTVTAVRSKCPGCKVLAGGMVYLPTPITMGQLDFMSGMQELVPTIFDQVDGIGFHAYTFYPPVHPPETRNLNQVPFDEAMQSVRDACGCDRPLWVTETGWTAVGQLTETDRARYAVRGLLLALTQGAQSWLWWSVRDVVREVLVAPAEGHFGLLAADGTPHPVYTALVQTVKELGDATEVTDVRREYRLASPYEWAIRFRWPDGRSADVFWYAGRGEGPRLPALQGKKGVVLTTGLEADAERLTADPVLVRP